MDIELIKALIMGFIIGLSFLVGYIEGQCKTDKEWSKKMDELIAENKRVYNEFVKRHLS